MMESRVDEVCYIYMLTAAGGGASRGGGVELAGEGGWS